MHTIQIPGNKKIYFLSDAHLGLPPLEKSLEREKLLTQWLDVIRKDAHSVYLLGDIFDYWFEYRKVVPRGFTRLLGKIAEITDSGIPVYFFTGNHDVWIFDYLPSETGIEVFRLMGTDWGLTISGTMLSNGYLLIAHCNGSLPVFILTHQLPLVTGGQNIAGFPKITFCPLWGKKKNFRSSFQKIFLKLSISIISFTATATSRSI
jgi:hypothetical protein